MKKTFTLLLLVLSFNSFGQDDIYQSLLEEHVHVESGYVYYKKLKSNINRLNEYLKYLSTMSPEDNWSENKEKAFWINVYNANILKIVVDNYSTENSTKNNTIFSLKENGKSVWDLPLIQLKDRKYSLNEIEHEIIRKKFKDPRVHAVFNSASKSGSKVANFAFTENNIDLKLDVLMNDFINDATKNSIAHDKVYLSKIFDWYKNDFTIKQKNILKYINRYSNIKINPNAEIEFLQFNWILNDR